MRPITSALFALTALSLTAFGTASCAEEEPVAESVAAEAASETDSGVNTQIAQADATAPDQATNGPTYREIIIGDENAPVTIIEYASLTCSHCAAFHTTVLPKLKETYIDTGKVRLVFRDFPLDGLAMAGAMLARCAPGDRGEALLSVMFRNQLTWVRSQSPIEPLTSYAKLAGLSEDDVNACLQNQDILQGIRSAQEDAASRYQIAATPTFFIEDTKVEGNRSFEYMAEIIDEKLDDIDS